MEPSWVTAEAPPTWRVSRDMAASTERSGPAPSTESGPAPSPPHRQLTQGDGVVGGVQQPLPVGGGQDLELLGQDGEQLLEEETRSDTLA